MGQYRVSRNIEASLVEYIEAELINASWNNVAVEKSFSKIYEISLPSIWIHLGSTAHEKVELGSEATSRIPSVFVNVFAKDDGGRLDLKDFLVSILKGGCPYYEYTIVSGSVQSKVQNGRLKVTEILDDGVDLGVDKADLDVHDRYRHLLTLTIAFGKVEA